MQKSQLTDRTDSVQPDCASWWTLGFVTAVLVLRAVAAFMVPIMDDTEARYAEIARKMVETGNWITPQFDYGVPFWGKPPLSTWLSALGIAAFGANEFGPRAPILLLSTALLILFWRFARENETAFTAHLATIMLTTSALFLVAAGAVMTDMVLVFSLFVMMSACWRFTREWNPKHGRWMFAGIGLGLLTKGLMVLAAGGLPIAVWLTLTKKWKPFLTRLPWGTGGLIAAAIALPWYMVAEMKTPGFLHYFFIGEHFNRFLVPGWQGDRYGFAHAQPVGMIWGFYLIGLAPWSVLIPAYLLLTRRKPAWMNFKESGPQREWALFLLCWAFVPALLLTFARNIIWTYALPAAPPVAMLLAMSLRGPQDRPQTLRNVLAIATVLAAAAFGYMLYAAQHLQAFPLPTHKAIVMEYRTRCAERDVCHLWVFGERVFSAEYYMKGQAKRTERVNFLLQATRGKKRDYLAARDHLIDRLHPSEKKHLIPVKRFDGTTLWRIER